MLVRIVDILIKSCIGDEYYSKGFYIPNYIPLIYTQS